MWKKEKDNSKRRSFLLKESKLKHAGVIGYNSTLGKKQQLLIDERMIPLGKKNIIWTVKNWRKVQEQFFGTKTAISLLEKMTKKDLQQLIFKCRIRCTNRTHG